jgi:hypothetical protein
MTDNLFTCSETPLKFPQTMDIKNLYPCTSCILRLNAEVAGLGNVTADETGLVLNENPQTTLTVNGISHNLLEAFMYIPGAHRLPGQQDVHSLEVALYFRDGAGQKTVCLCIPVQVGADNPYFAALNQMVSKRPSVGSLVSPTSSIISYRGADMRGRTGQDSRPRTKCDPVARVVTYYVVMTPSSISEADYKRLEGVAGGGGGARKGPPKAILEVIESRYKLLTRIDGIKVVNTPAAANNGIDTKAMKCYRLNKDRDVVNDKVYIGGSGPGSTLENELKDAGATQADGEDSKDTSIQPGDIEKWVGIVIGATVGIILVACLIYLIWSRTFRNYVNVQKMYETPVSTLTKVIPPPAPATWAGFKLPEFLCTPPSGAAAAAAAAATTTTK